VYESYWNLTEKPFMNTPDSRFIYFSHQHEEALTRMLYAITEDKGAMLLTGDYGCGKTLLSRTLLEQLDPDRYDMAILPQPNLKPEELLQEILSQFGYTAPASANKTDLLNLFQTCLTENERAGRKTIILVDEAQMVNNPATLEEIRVLLNYQRNGSFLLTLFLLGQPELLDTLEGLPQLDQRLSIRYHLGPLSEEDSRSYLRHRLKTAKNRHELFESKAEALLIKAAEGIPRKLNNLADMALLVGFGMQVPLIDTEIMRKVMGDQERT
jgi:type II secretory pathway predicted ATPase ExeA